MVSLAQLQLPEGASSLLGLLAHHGELAAAVTGHGDASDVGPVVYESVLSVVEQALTNLNHSIKAQQRLHASGGCIRCFYYPKRQVKHLTG